ncbi:unnamed protein product, partial [marine sediment metagenome]
MNDIVVRNVRKDFIKGGDAFFKYSSQAFYLTFLNLPKIRVVSFRQDTHL